MYDLFDVVKEAIEDCVHINKSEWKRLVSSKIWDRQNKEWNVRKSLYRTLAFAGRSLRKVSMLPWWHYCQFNSVDVRKCRCIVKILLDCNLLKACKYRQDNDISNPFCDYCDCRGQEDIEHVLFRCSENNEARRKLWLEIKEVCPEALYRDIINMPITERVAFLLGGLGQFTLEWLPLYTAIVKYIYTLYNTRINRQRIDL